MCASLTATLKATMAAGVDVVASGTNSTARLFQQVHKVEPAAAAATATASPNSIQKTAHLSDITFSLLALREFIEHNMQSSYKHTHLPAQVKSLPSSTVA